MLDNKKIIRPNPGKKLLKKMLFMAEMIIFILNIMDLASDEWGRKYL